MSINLSICDESLIVFTLLKKNRTFYLRFPKYQGALIKRNIKPKISSQNVKRITLNERVKIKEFIIWFKKHNSTNDGRFS